MYSYIDYIYEIALYGIITNIEAIVVAFDETNTDEVVPLIKDLDLMLNNMHDTPIITFKKPSSSINELLNSITDYFNENKDVKEIVILNYYTDIVLVEAWHDYTPPSSTQKLTLINMQTVPREKLFASTKSQGSMIKSENAFIPPELIQLIGTGLDNTKFSFTSIQLYIMYSLYFTVGNEYLNGDLSSGSDIIYNLYKSSDYVTLFKSTTNDDKLVVGLSGGNRLKGYVYYGEVDNGVIGTIDHIYTPKISVSYTYIDGFPRDEICNQLVSKTFTKPDLLYIVVMTYRNFFTSSDKSTFLLSKFDKNVGYTFQAAINYINTNVYILLLFITLLQSPVLNKQIIAIYIDLSQSTEDTIKEYLQYNEKFTILGIFSTANFENMNSFIGLLNQNNVTEYTYIRVKPDASNFCKRNIIPISFFFIYQLNIYFS